MTAQANDTREQIALDDARFTMFAHRLTYSVVQTRLREAAAQSARVEVVGEDVWLHDEPPQCRTMPADA